MLSTNIRRICRDRDISFRELERACDLGNGSIRRWDQVSPRVYAVKAVADYLGVTVDDLLQMPEGSEKAAGKGDGRRKKEG